MSHWIKVTTKMKSTQIASKALTALGHKHEVAEAGKKLTVSAAGTTSEVDIKLCKDLGMKQQADGTLAFVGDFYYNEYNEKKLTSSLSTRYYVEDAVEKLEEQGFFVDADESFTVNERGHIEFTAVNPHI